MESVINGGSRRGKTVDFYLFIYASVYKGFVLDGNWDNLGYHFIILVQQEGILIGLTV